MKSLAPPASSGVCPAEPFTFNVNEVKTKTAGLEDTWVKAAEAKGLKNAKQVLADYRAEIAKLQK